MNCCPFARLKVWKNSDRMLNTRKCSSGSNSFHKWSNNFSPVGHLKVLGSVSHASHAAPLSRSSNLARKLTSMEVDYNLTRLWYSHCGIAIMCSLPVGFLGSPRSPGLTLSLFGCSAQEASCLAHHAQNAPVSIQPEIQCRIPSSRVPPKPTFVVSTICHLSHPGPQLLLMLLTC